MYFKTVLIMLTFFEKKVFGGYKSQIFVIRDKNARREGLKK